MRPSGVFDPVQFPWRHSFSATPLFVFCDADRFPWRFPQRHSTMGQNQVILRHQKFTFPQAKEWAKWASKWTSERKGGCKRSEQYGASERVSGAREQANGWASGPVLTSLFVFVPDHSAFVFCDATVLFFATPFIFRGAVCFPRRRLFSAAPFVFRGAVHFSWCHSFLMTPSVFCDALTPIFTGL